MLVQNMSLYRKRSHVSTKFTQICSNHQTSSNLPGNSPAVLPKTPPTSPNSKFHPPRAWRSKKCKSLRKLLPQRSRGVPQECRGVFRTEAVDTEAAAAVDAAEDIHSIGHVAPHRCVDKAACGRRATREQLTPAICLAKVAQMF